MELMAERLESLKAGVIGSISLGLAFLVTTLINIFWLEKYFPILIDTPLPKGEGILHSTSKLALAGFHQPE